MRGPKWTAPEDDQLLALAGNLPFRILYAAYCNVAKQKGWPPRTNRAVRYRLWSHGQSVVPTGSYVAISSVADTLGITPTAIRIWVRRGELHSTKSGHHNYVKLTGKDSLSETARRFPERFAHCDRMTLYTLFANDELIDHIYEHRAHEMRRKPIIVVCVHNGIRYPSIGAAARAVKISGAHLADKLKHGERFVGGYEWQVCA